MQLAVVEHRDGAADLLTEEQIELCPEDLCQGFETELEKKIKHKPHDLIMRTGPTMMNTVQILICYHLEYLLTFYQWTGRYIQLQNYSITACSTSARIYMDLVYYQYFHAQPKPTFLFGCQ
jgi:hypothetical protein